MLLEEIIKTHYNKKEPIIVCNNPKLYNITINEIELSFVGPDVANGYDKLYCESRNDATIVYYKIVAGLLYDYFDLLISDPFVFGSKIVSRADMWKSYDDFLAKLDAVQTEHKPTEFFEENFINSRSIWDSLVEYMESQELVDHEDIASYLSPTFKQRLEAELQNRNMIKGLTPTKTLF